ncbi:MAG TPA: N-acetylmuramoyl-L-alanine amidase [Roseiflexaceae bacterium]|nr:N-acetylmuramoyl-L-alanine amidase [Roseiflexaceae bacterium]
MSETFDVRQVTSAPSASSSRQGFGVSLIVIHDDPRPIADVLSAAQETAAVPHYFIDTTGQIAQLVPEDRAARHVGKSLWNKRVRNIDRISIGIALEAQAQAGYSARQLAALHWLLDEVERRHKLDDSAIVYFDPRALNGRGLLTHYLPPPTPPKRQPAVLGIEDDSLAAQRLWVFLQNYGYSQRGGGFKYTLNQLGQAFSVYATKFDLGAPVAPNEPTPVVVDGVAYNYQAFARDTIFNAGRDYSAVQSLNSLLVENAIPAGGLARALLEASYKSALAASSARASLKGNTAFHDDWRFHYVAMRERFGPALSGNYVTDDGQWAVQVYPGDTLYTPMSDQAGCLLLSQTDPGAPEYTLIWQETYKISGATFDPNSPFHQQAIQLDIGTPLTGVVTLNFEGSNYQVHVYGHDTLYAGPDGAIKRMSGLPKPADIQAWQPAVPSKPVPVPPPPAATPPSTPIVVVGGTPVRDVNWPARPNFNPLPNNAARQQVFGTFDFQRTNGDNIRILGNWVQDNIVTVAIPQLANVNGAAGGNIQFHKLAAEQLRAMWAAWDAAGLLRFVLSWSGSFVPRFMRSGKQLSTHAFGCAFDINVPWNGYYKVPALVGDQGSVRELVPIANQHGFYWGGHFQYGHGLSDGMHFEWARPA